VPKLAAMSAELIARALGGKREGASWLAFCPAHADRKKPSLALCDGDGGIVLVHCHAGCQQAAVIDALRARGLWGLNGAGSSSRPGYAKPVEREPDRDAVRRTEAALSIWRSAKPAPGTLVEIYLGSRGIHLPPPPSLRFHAGLKHPEGSTWPTMVALVTSGVDGIPVAIHRTLLAHDGRGKAPVDPSKMMLGSCRGGAVRLAESGSPLLIAEGIETALSGMQMSGHAAWAALSTSGLRALELPEDARDIIILADADDAGEAAALACGWRWKQEGRRVRIARPPTGKDFNDTLTGQASRIEESAP
jgi:putative DNA primase/helicase